MAGEDLTETIDFDTLVRRLEALDTGRRRHFVAVAGAPGSGKSAVSERLVARLNAQPTAQAAILPMDGFHYDNIYLEPLGLLPRKGAPETFDVAGFESTLARLSDGSGRAVAVPVFDRSIEVARAGARVISPEIRLVIVEGNYLLLDRPYWRDLSPYFDITVFLDVPIDVLHQRLLDRWTALAPAAAVRQVDGNDLPNARLVISHSMPPDFRLPNE
ncbi:nucleoside triphosphate hydrolase [Palleronia abyssalis]|uniref:Pantothenate kinase n=1 Tax=Palleronia abyssalis TaxID=1501240 RepID=A0A2R8C106_9RHOB|nr:nucleoside triphosphate hydrolase [Palleronia abyssalis]SPJ26098.1 Pantothenate kinase [Palleronia abyssalis]